MGQAFKLTGNDHIVINGYKGISGTKARTLSLWFKTQNASWRTLAYWGSNTRGQRWWLRLNGNDLRIDFWGSVRNTTEFKLNDGVWHSVVTVLPEEETTVRLLFFTSMERKQRSTDNGEDKIN